jgi:hypothetical protein
MASNGAAEVMSADVVLQAMATMRSRDVEKKKAAMDYLQTFQKSVRRLTQTTIYMFRTLLSRTSTDHCYPGNRKTPGR